MVAVSCAAGAAAEDLGSPYFGDFKDPYEGVSDTAAVTSGDLNNPYETIPLRVNWIRHQAKIIFDNKAEIVRRRGVLSASQPLQALLVEPLDQLPPLIESLEKAEAQRRHPLRETDVAEGKQAVADARRAVFQFWQKAVATEEDVDEFSSALNDVEVGRSLLPEAAP